MTDPTLLEKKSINSDRGNLERVVIDPRYPNIAHFIFSNGIEWQFPTTVIPKIKQIFGKILDNPRLYVTV